MLYENVKIKMTGNVQSPDEVMYNCELICMVTKYPWYTNQVYINPVQTVYMYEIGTVK